MDFNFDIKGAQLIERKLSNLTKRLERKIGVKALRAGGRILIKAARNNLRRVGAYKTGNLAKSIAQKAIPAKFGRLGVEIGARSGKDQKYDGWYAHLVEYGVQPHSVAKGSNLSSNKQKGKPHPGHPPKPFMRPAIDNNRDTVPKEVGRVLYEEIEKTMKEGN